MLSAIFLIICSVLSFVLGNDNPCQSLSSQNEIDTCYMKIALDYGLARNPRAPFGTLMVNHVTNTITCIGVNNNRESILFHGESVAFANCTSMYPSPTGDDLFNPGVAWNDHTLYTTGEPCPMCSAQIVFRNVKRVVWGTSMKDVSKFGRMRQLTLGIHNVMHSANVMGEFTAEENLPSLEGGVLKEECDHAFWCAFKGFRDDTYMKLMEENGDLDYVLERDEKFPCVTIPWRK